MDAGSIYDRLGTDVTVDVILDAAGAFPSEVQDELDTALVEYGTDEVVTREEFVLIMDRIAAALAGEPSPKLVRLADLFDSMSIDGNIRFESLKSIFGANAGLVVPDETEQYDFDGFVDNFGDLFDDNGDIKELPPSMIEQLKAINHRISALGADVDYEQNERVAAEERLHAERRRHANETEAILSGAAAVEDQRDSLYAELKAVRRQLAQKRESEVFDDFDAADAVLAPAVASTHAPVDAPPLPPPFQSEVKYASIEQARIQTFEASRSSSFLGDSDDADDLVYAPPLEPEPPSEPEPPLVDFPGPPPAGPPVVDFPGLPGSDPPETELTYDVIEDAVPEDPPDSPSEAVVAWASAKPPITEYIWYKGKMNRPDAERYLDGMPNGSFVVRDSSMEGRHALSIRKNAHRVLHYVIIEIDAGVALHFVHGSTLEMVEPVFGSIPDLVDHFRGAPVNQDTPVLIDEPTVV